MKRRIFLILLGTAAFASLALQTVWAGETKMTAAAIRTLLSGNSIEGTWAGSNYKQYFAENGLTIYSPEGGQPDEGRWRANEQTNDYESWWRMTGWTPYAIVYANGSYAYVNGRKLEPFRIVKGKQINW